MFLLDHTISSDKQHITTDFITLEDDIYLFRNLRCYSRQISWFGLYSCVGFTFCYVFGKAGKTKKI